MSGLLLERMNDWRVLIKQKLKKAWETRLLFINKTPKAGFWFKIVFFSVYILHKQKLE